MDSLELGTKSNTTLIDFDNPPVMNILLPVPALVSFLAQNFVYGVCKQMTKDLQLEIELRVINGYYPKGEPEPGTWIKKLRKEKIPD